MELSRQVQVAIFWYVASFKIKHLDLSLLCAYSHLLFFLARSGSANESVYPVISCTTHTEKIT